MLQTVLTPSSVMELRSEVLAYLRSVATLLDEAGRPLDREQHYRDLAMLVENERRKVENLELRMAIVAPMKAGKSTIVNAILGQGILPARNSAMTSIPSEIVRANSAIQPQLQVPGETIERFSYVWSRVRSEVTRRGLAAARQAIRT